MLPNLTRLSDMRGVCGLSDDCVDPEVVYDTESTDNLLSACSMSLMVDPRRARRVRKPLLYLGGQSSHLFPRDDQEARTVLQEVTVTWTESGILGSAVKHVENTEEIA